MAVIKHRMKYQDPKMYAPEIKYEEKLGRKKIIIAWSHS